MAEGVLQIGEGDGWIDLRRGEAITHCLLTQRECQVLFFELYHHTCYRDNITEFKEIMKVIREVANGKEG